MHRIRNVSKIRFLLARVYSKEWIHQTAKAQYAPLYFIAVLQADQKQWERETEN